MHNPERWGLLQFSSSVSPSSSPAVEPVYYDEWPARSMAMAVYGAQHARFAAEGAFASCLTDLAPYSSPPFELCPSAEAVIELIVDGDTGATTGFTATVPSPDGAPLAATVTTDRLLTVTRGR
jgi:hypothetical protein